MVTKENHDMNTHRKIQLDWIIRNYSKIFFIFKNDFFFKSRFPQIWFFQLKVHLSQLRLNRF